MSDLQEKLYAVQNYDLMNSMDKDTVASIVGIDTGKRVRDVTDEDILLYHKDLVKEQLTLKCDEVIAAGFTATVTGHFYRTNDKDMVNFIGEYVDIKDDLTITETFWKTEDAGALPHTRDEFIAVYKEAKAHVRSTISHLWAKKQEIDACPGHAEVRGVTW